MTRNYGNGSTASGQFSRSNGTRTETIEIRPLRPNQAVILPGVGVKGKGVKLEVRREVVVAQLAERSLPIPEDPGSNPDIGKFY